MPHLKPISETNAPAQVKKSYQEIRETFAIEIVPLLFQYLANFEEYFAYTLERIQKNVAHENFPKIYKEIIAFSQASVSEVYIPSPLMQKLVQSFSQEEQARLLQTVSDLEEINAKLLLLSIGLRESIKGVFVGLIKLDDSFPFANINLHTEYPRTYASVTENDEEIAVSTNMLIPLFGSQAIQISHMPEFFEQSAREMESFITTEKYLEKRVALEHVVLQGVSNLTYPLGGTYQEIMKLAGNKPHFKELFYLLVETFPSAFPRLLLTTAVMESALQKETGLTKSSLLY